MHFHGLCNSISIHALRVEGDTNAKYTIIRKKDFYPRPPGGGRPKNIELCKKGVLFLSTPSGWRATSGQIFDKRGVFVFLSTPSGWRATPCNINLSDYDGFLSTPSGWRATAGVSGVSIGVANFYPRPPGGGRHVFTGCIV